MNVRQNVLMAYGLIKDILTRFKDNRTDDAPHKRTVQDMIWIENTGSIKYLLQ